MEKFPRMAILQGKTWKNRAKIFQFARRYSISMEIQNKSLFRLIQKRSGTGQARRKGFRNCFQAYHTAQANCNRFIRLVALSDQAGPKMLKSILIEV
jgi:hypothetical protein